MLKIKNRQVIGKTGSLIPKKIQDGFVGLTQPLIQALGRWGIHPNTITVLGVIISGLAALVFLRGHFRIGGVLLLLGGLCDLVDGALARSMNKVTCFGALFDSTVDRYAELITFFGIAVYFIVRHDYLTMVAIFLAVCGSVMVSYTRARAESLGFDAKVGWMQRPERILIIALGALMHPVVLKISIWVVAIFANYTAAQRILYAYRQDLKKLEK